MCRSHRPKQTEEVLGVLDVKADLGAEGFGTGPVDFGAESAEEGEGERGALVEWDGVEVEEMGLDGGGVLGKFSGEGGAVADVGDGVEGFGGGAGADLYAGDVDAVGGEELGVGGEVDGGDGVPGAVAAA